MMASKQRIALMLNAYVPYQTIVNINDREGHNRILVALHRYESKKKFDVIVSTDDEEDYMPKTYYLEEVKPYLRSVSEMTKNEVNTLFDILGINEEEKGEWLKVNDIGTIRLFTAKGKDIYEIEEAIQYLNSIHVDYMGYIDEGIAKLAPEGMYNDTGR